MKRKKSTIVYTLLVILSLSYDCLFSQTLIPYYDNGIFGYANVDGEVVIKPDYDDVAFFGQNDLALVRKDTIQYYINKRGERLIKASGKLRTALLTVINRYTQQYEYGRSRDTLHNLRVVMLGNQKYQFININNFEVSSVFEREKMNYRYSSPRRWAIQFINGYFIGKTLTNQYEVLDKDCKVIKASDTKPTILSKDHYSYLKGDSTFLYNHVSDDSISIPFNTIEQKVLDKYLIVSNTNGNRRLLPFKPQAKKGLIDVKGNLILDTVYQDLKYYEHKNIIATQKESFFIEFNGNPINNKRYTKIYPLNESIYAGKLSDGKIMMIDSVGVEMKIGAFDKIVFRPNENYYAWNKADIVGIIDSNLTHVIEYQADAIYSIDNITFKVEKEGKVGVINKEKKIIVPIQYDNCYQRDSNFYTLVMNDKKGLANLNGDILFQPEYEEITIDIEGNDIFFITKKNDLYACYDHNLNLIHANSTRRIYISNRSVNWYRSDDIYHFTDRYGMSLNLSSKNFNTGYTESDSTFIVVLNKGKSINEIILENDSLFRAKKGNAVISKVNIKAGLFGISNDSLEGVINHLGEVILPLSKREITEINSRFIIVKENNKFNLFTLNGELLHKDGFDYVSDSPINGNRVVGNNIEGKTYEFIKSACIYGKEDTVTRNHRNYGYIDMNGKVVVPLEYNKTFRYFDKYACVTKGFDSGEKQSFLVNTNGDIVLKTSYDNLYPLDHTDETGHYVATKNDKKGLIDINGKIVIPFEYNSIQGFHNNEIISVQDFDDNWKLLNLKNEILFSGNEFYKEGAYEQCIELPNKKYIFYPNNKTEIIDLNGNRYLNFSSQDVYLVKKSNLKLIQVNIGDTQYYINAETLVEYRSNGD